MGSSKVRTTNLYWLQKRTRSPRWDLRRDAEASCVLRVGSRYNICSG